MSDKSGRLVQDPAPARIRIVWDMNGWPQIRVTEHVTTPETDANYIRTDLVDAVIARLERRISELGGVQE